MVRKVMSLACLGLMAGMANAQAEFNTLAKQAILVDMNSGAVLFEKEADARMTPSSMSKLMTLYLVFDRIKHGTLKLDDTFPVSVKAWQMGGSKMFVREGTDVRIEDLLHGVIIQSGNDACVVLAEGISGSEEAFAEEMNRVAKEIGLTGSHFVNSTGWPDPNHYMTAHDLAVLSERLVQDFPDLYPLFAMKEYTYNNIRQPNRNLLLNRESTGVDGLKTGHTEDGGYGIAVSAAQGDRRLVLVVNGLSSEKERATEAERLVHYGFKEFETQTPMKKGQMVDQAAVWMGEAETVPLTVAEDVTLTLPLREKDRVTMKMTYDGPVPAPVQAGQRLGTLTMTVPGMGEQSVPLVAGAEVPALSGVARIWPAFKHLVLGAS